METNKNILMKMLRMATFLMVTPLLFTACSDDDDALCPLPCRLLPWLTPQQ